MEKANVTQIEEIRRLEPEYIHWTSLSRLNSAKVIVAANDLPSTYAANEVEVKLNDYYITYNQNNKIGDVYFLDEFGCMWIASIDKSTINRHDISNMF